MDVTILNPIAATPDLTASSILHPTTPGHTLSPDELREVNIVELGTAMAARGLRVTIVLGGLNRARGPVRLSANLSVVPMRTLMPFPFHPGVFPMTPELMHHPALRDTEVIQSGEFHQPTTFFAAESSLEHDIPLVVWQETFRPMRFPASLYQAGFERTVGRKVRAAASRCVPRTTAARGYLLALGILDRAIPPWIPTGIDLTSFMPRASSLTPSHFGWEETCSVLLVVARLHPSKGIDDAIRALARLAKIRPDVRLLIRGTGPQEERLKRLARELGVADLMRFLPRMSRSAMVDLYNLANVVLCPSRNDLLPFSLMEASACGRPIVATRVGAVTDIVVDGHTGSLVSPGDPERLVAAIATLLGDEETCSVFGRAARERAERHFNVRVTAQRLVEVYDAIAE